MPVVLLVRHGQASFGAADYDVLSELGRQQAEVVGRELARRQLRQPVVVSGRLRRQRDTATLAVQAAGLDVEVAVDGRFDEYDHTDLVQRYPSTPHDGTSRGLQDLLDVALRRWVEDDEPEGWGHFTGGAAAALQELVAELPSGRDALVVSSGGIIAALCSGLLGLGAGGVVALNRVVANGSITKLTVGRSGTTLVTFNDHAHFEGEARHLLTYR